MRGRERQKAALVMVYNSPGAETVHFKMGSESTIIWGMLFGMIGVGFFMYGKKQRAVVPLFTGVALFVLPYFVRI